jgi:hypothetical protein
VGQCGGEGCNILGQLGEFVLRARQRREGREHAKTGRERHQSVFAEDEVLAAELAGLCVAI